MKEQGGKKKSCADLPVHVMLWVRGKLKIHNVRQVWDIQAPRCELSGYHEPESAILDARQNLLQMQEVKANC
jgi:hypothetical protein